MTDLLEPRWLSLAFTFLIQFFLFLRWLHKRLRDDEINRVFVRDIATNHLPHIYELLQQLCEQQEIQNPKPPAVRWISLDK
jgi:hypothetical protein